jgi:regulator of RNase E activity RraA
MPTTDTTAPRQRADALSRVEEILTEYSPSCLVADANPGVGVVGDLQTVNREHRIAGRALTVEVPPDDLVDILPVFAQARRGDIVVVACHGVMSMAMWGGVMATMATMAGIRGAVVDGAVRDIDELRALDFPLWYRGANPRRCPPESAGGSVPLKSGLPVLVGGTTIRPGDIIVADENGLGVVPPELADEVVTNVHDLVARERAMRDRITAGLTLRELLGEFGHL